MSNFWITVWVWIKLTFKWVSVTSIAIWAPYYTWLYFVKWGSDSGSINLEAETAVSSMVLMFMFTYICYGILAVGLYYIHQDVVIPKVKAILKKHEVLKRQQENIKEQDGQLSKIT